MNIKYKLFLALVFLVIFSHDSSAQGDGPRSWMLGPKNMFNIDAKWLNLKQNIVPSGNLFVPEADLEVNVFPVTAAYTFGIGGRFSQVQAMINPGSVKGTVDLSKYGLSSRSISGSGFSDGFISYRIGLIGAPALTVGQFLKKKPGFSMMGMLRVWYSGSYDSASVINMGTNRWTFEPGLPMSVPFGGGKMPFWWETVPSIQFFTSNNSPSLASRGAKEIEQNPLFIWENHITKNFTPEFWTGVDFRYLLGGKTIVDGKADEDTKMDIFGAAISMGYQVLPYLDLKASYGRIIWGFNDADSEMLRLSATFTYVNVKDLK